MRSPAPDKGSSQRIPDRRTLDGLWSWSHDRSVHRAPWPDPSEVPDAIPTGGLDDLRAAANARALALEVGEALEVEVRLVSG